MSVKDDLINYYSVTSKHSNYQALPTKLQTIIGTENVQTRTRHEKERLQYLLSKIDVDEKSVLDIGGNTGYFIFELLDAGASRVHLYEGNKEHAEFVELAAKALELQDKVTVTNDYFLFNGGSKDKYDIALLFNVLHHVGDDYGDKNISLEQAREQIIKQLNSLSAITDVVVFQLGFNWMGDVKRPLFERGTKKEIIDFVTEGIKDTWNIEAIGVAEYADNGITYHDLNSTNIKRIDSLGEFLNRPIFILKSLGKTA